ncbi:hypothetical protein TNCV_1675971 [Trichonephila clavipes]|nr:hypothetical protein TNCV_1675971 [Trichonephila clavipes]
MEIGDRFPPFTKTFAQIVRIKQCSLQTAPFDEIPETRVILRKFCNAKKGDNRLVPGPDYMVDALKLPNQTPRVSGESLQTCVAWRYSDGTQHFFCWPILAVSSQLLASKGPVVDS